MLYNGILFYYVTGGLVQDVKAQGIPGNASMQPGETFGGNDLHGTGNTWQRFEADGRDFATGTPVGASGFGGNQSKQLTILDSSSHHNPYSAGFTCNTCTDVTMRNTAATDNGKMGFNFERVGGTVVLDRISALRNGGPHIAIASDQTNAVYELNDITFDGPQARRQGHRVLRRPAHAGPVEDHVPAGWRAATRPPQHRPRIGGRPWPQSPYGPTPTRSRPGSTSLVDDPVPWHAAGRRPGRDLDHHRRQHEHHLGPGRVDARVQRRLSAPAPVTSSTRSTPPADGTGSQRAAEHHLGRRACQGRDRRPRRVRARRLRCHRHSHDPVDVVHHVHGSSRPGRPPPRT
jgi:hypothetical protein